MSLTIKADADVGNAARSKGRFYGDSGYLPIPRQPNFARQQKLFGIKFVTERSKQNVSGNNEDQWNAFLDVAVGGILVIDETGTINAFSADCESLFGYTANEVIGENVTMLIPGSDPAEQSGPRMINIGREATGRRKDGSRFPLYLSVGEYHGAAVIGYVGVIHDLSGRNRSEVPSFRRQDENQPDTIPNTVNETLSALAFELTQPLTAIANYTEACKTLMEQDPKGVADEGAADKALDCARRANEQAYRAGEIVRRIAALTERREPDK